MSDNGPEFKGTLEREHHFETMCSALDIKHIYTKPYRPQTNGKIEAFWKILKNEFFYPNSFIKRGCPPARAPPYFSK